MGESVVQRLGRGVFCDDGELMRILVSYIDVLPWRRWRHQRLRRIWRALEESARAVPNGTYTIRPFLNDGKLSHAECLQAQWDNLRWTREADILVLTEMDFLPTPLWLEELAGDLRSSAVDVLAPVRQRANAGDTAPFLMAFRARCGLQGLRFDHPRDPAADLHEQIAVKHFTGIPGSEIDPPHPGWSYRYGDHLLYQRHLHDPVDIRLHSGMLVGEMIELHDRFVESWLDGQPETFKEQYQELLDKEKTK